MAISGFRSLRLRTLVRLRWLAVIGQTATVLYVHLVLGFPFPFQLCLAIIAISALANVALAWRWRPSVRLRDGYAALLLAYDILQLALLLFLTGGLENPFSFLFLVPVTVSASSLPLRWIISLFGLALVCASVLTFWHLPLPWTAGQHLYLPRTYIAGMWTALICGVVFASLYARRISQEARQMFPALTATELVLAREQRLSALDGLAAAAAHELGTPLATIALVAKELKRELPPDGPVGEDIDLLISQSARCRDILSRLAHHDDQSDEIFTRVKLSAMIDDVVAPLRGPDIRIEVNVASQQIGPLRDDEADEPTFARNPAIAYGLSNLIDNALDFAKHTVWITGRWNKSEVSISVVDDGPGFSQEIFDRLGDPFVTTRRGFTPGDDPPREGQHEGMGLGFFIAKTLLERSGATVTLANPIASSQGADIQIVWPRSRVDHARPMKGQSKFYGPSL